MRTDLSEGKADSNLHSLEDKVQRKEKEGNTVEGEKQYSSIQGSIVAICMYPMIFCISLIRQNKYPLLA